MDIIFIGVLFGLLYFIWWAYRAYQIKSITFMGKKYVGEKAERISKRIIAISIFCVLYTILLRLL